MTYAHDTWTDRYTHIDSSPVCIGNTFRTYSFRRASHLMIPLIYFGFLRYRRFSFRFIYYFKHVVYCSFFSFLFFISFFFFLPELFVSVWLSICVMSANARVYKSLISILLFFSFFVFDCSLHNELWFLTFHHFSFYN